MEYFRIPNQNRTHEKVPSFPSLVPTQFCQLTVISLLGQCLTQDCRGWWQWWGTVDYRQKIIRGNRIKPLVLQKYSEEEANWEVMKVSAFVTNGMEVRKCWTHLRKEEPYVTGT